MKKSSALALLVFASVANARVSHAADAGALPQDAPPAAASASPLHVLITGGGPDQQNNQVAIESNVRYVTRLLPTGAVRRTLFTDGHTDSRNVRYEDRSGQHYRATQIPALDGPSQLDAFHRSLTDLARPDAPLLLYFTGHGSPESRRSYANNRYDMWGDQELTVRRLSREIAALPPGEPVTLVMVECFSGAFGNLLFQDGTPTGSLVDRPICGFFASLDLRMAAGCTPEINEADYHDFTGYFFAALGGVSRIGRPVGDADYNHDGTVGMNEAFAYALSHDESIDTPVCTSDVFLRRYVKYDEVELFGHSYSMVRGWATPAQAAALDAISTRLRLTGEDSVARAWGRFRNIDIGAEDSRDVFTLRYIRLAKSIVLAHMLMTDPSAVTADAQTLRARYAALIRLESANPLKQAAPNANAVAASSLKSPSR